MAFLLSTWAGELKGKKNLDEKAMGGEAWGNKQSESQKSPYCPFSNHQREWSQSICRTIHIHLWKQQMDRES